MDSVIRAMAAADTEQVRFCWGSDIADDLELLSYDRWGPGIAVPARPDVDEVKVQVLDPKEGMTRYLDHLLTAEDMFCLVAVRGDRVLGYVVAEIQDQGVNDFRAGEISALYVRDEERRRGVGGELVRAALRELRERDVWSFRVVVDDTRKGADAFWRSQQWERDAVVYRLYD
ncbi:GNAT family N-acetyltransferase [Spirillospora sp. NPDC050679]